MSRDQRLGLAISVLASFASFLDGTIVNLALPAIMRELGGGLAAQQWVVDACLMTLGALTVVVGSLSDVYGRLLILRVGVIGFVSPRELDVLRLVATGLKNADIGRALYIGEATVKSHLLRVFAKLEVADRTRAVMRGIELGLIETPRA